MTVEELQAQVLKLQDEAKVKDGEIANLTKERDDLKKSGQESATKISDLQTLNEKLFLRVSTGAPAVNPTPSKTDKDEELTPDEIVAKCIATEEKK